MTITKTVLVTGGAGFIGSHLVEQLVNSSHLVINLDLLTYAGNLDNLAALKAHPNHIFVKGSIADRELVNRLLSQYRPTSVINIAAETHVDRSIDHAAGFVETNVNGTFNLLECSLAYWNGLESASHSAFRFVQMSTDEVYGSISTGLFSETSNYAPNSPYAASKAAGDHFVRAYCITHGLPTILVHASNTYGPRQYPEKLIPHMLHRAMSGQSLPVYGNGGNVRDWMFVDDLVAGLCSVVAAGHPGAVYNFAGGNERANIDVVKSICMLLDQHSPQSGPHEKTIEFVKDRPGHDLRYAMSYDLAAATFGWKPATSFESGLSATIQWYMDNSGWLNSLLKRGYEAHRIGFRQES